MSVDLLSLISEDKNTRSCQSNSQIKKYMITAISVERVELLLSIDLCRTIKIYLLSEMLL